MASRVVPASGATTCRSSPSSLLMIDDLPAFGRPTTATLIDSGDSSSPSGSDSTSLSSRSPLPLPTPADVPSGSPRPRL